MLIDSLHSGKVNRLLIVVFRPCLVATRIAVKQSKQTCGTIGIIASRESDVSMLPAATRASAPDAEHGVFHRNHVRSNL